MPDLLVDTDVLIDHLRGATRFDPPEGTRVHCSVITRAELVAGPAEHEAAANVLLGSTIEISVDPEVADAAGRIRRATKVPLPDALIAATAITHGLELLTRNRRDFARIDGLRLAS